MQFLSAGDHQTPSPYTRVLFLGLLFILCFSIGLTLWEHILLPFHNPLEIKSKLTEIGFNPANNIVRFVVLQTLPLLGLFLVFCFALLPNDWAKSVFPLHRPLPHPISGPAHLFPVFAVLLLAFALFYSAELPTPFSTQHYLDTFHEGESLGPAMDYMAGKAPYKETIFVHGIIQDPLRSIMAFSLFGKSIWGLRVLESILHSAALLLYTVFLLLVFRRKPMLALMASTLVAAMQVPFMGLEWLTVLSRDITTYSYFCTLPFMYNAFFSDKDTIAPRFFAMLSFLNSFIPLFAFSYSIDRGFFLAAAWLIMSIISYIVIFHRSNLRRTFIFTQLLGVIAAAMVFISLSRGAVQEFISFAFINMPKFKELMDGLILNVHDRRVLIVMAVLAGSLFLLAYRLFQEYLARRNAIEALRAFIKTYYVEASVTLTAVFFFRSALGRSDFAHIAKNALPTWTAFMLIIFRLDISKRFTVWLEHKHTTMKAIALALILLFFAMPDGNGDAIYSKFPLHRPDNSFLPREYRNVVHYMEENMKSNETFMTLTNESAWYYLLDRPCPTRFQVVWFAMPPFYQEEIVQALHEDVSIQYIIYSNMSWFDTIDGISKEERLPKVVSAVDELFDKGILLSGHIIRKRKDQSRTTP